MKREGVRRIIPRSQVRKAWQDNLDHAKEVGFCSYVIEAIADDSDDVRLCWCCGATGYQEVAHIIPHALGGRYVPANLFLLCAECHLASPDCLDPREFIRYINENSGKFSELLASVLKKVIDEVTVSLISEPEMVEGFGERFDLAIKEMAKKISFHGTYCSASTRMARISRP